MAGLGVAALANAMCSAVIAIVEVEKVCYIIKSRSNLYPRSNVDGVQFAARPRTYFYKMKPSTSKPPAKPTRRCSKWQIQMGQAI